MKISFHPAASIFPMLSKDELSELAKDIAEHGLLSPIVLLDGQILDGRNRFEACRLAGVKPRFENFQSSVSPTEWVLSQNLKRRHLTASQKAAAAVAALPLLEEEARERKTSTLKQNSTDTAKLPERENGEAREKAAKLTGASPRYVSDAKKIKESSPEVFEKVQAGEKTIQEAKRDLGMEPSRLMAEAMGPRKTFKPRDKFNLMYLKFYWRHATKAEQGDFLQWIGAK